MGAQERWRWHAAIFLTVIGWAAAGVMGRALALTIPPLGLAALRYGGGALIALLWQRTGRGSLAPTRGRWGVLGQMSVLGVFLQLPLFHLALQDTTAFRAMLLWSASPVFVALGAGLAGARLLRRQAAGILVAAGGIAVILFQQPNPGAAGWGDWLALATAATMAGFTLLVRKFGDRIDPVSIALHTNWMGAFMILPFAGVEATLLGWPALTAPQCAAVLFLVVVTGVSRGVWNAGIMHIGAVESSAYMYLQPLLTAGFAQIFLGETITWPVVVGGALVLVGTGLVHSPNSQRGQPG